MKTLLHIEYDGEVTAVSGKVESKDELTSLSIALANIFYEENELCTLVIKALDTLLEQDKINSIELDIDSITSKQVKS